MISPESGRQADGAQVALHPRPIGGGAEAEAHGEIERQGHAGRHRLAMQQIGAIAGFGLQGMGEGMAEIEQGAIALFRFVGRDDRAPWRGN